MYEQLNIWKRFACTKQTQHILDLTRFGSRKY